MSLAPILLAAAVMAHAPPTPPADVVHPDEQAAYAAWRDGAELAQVQRAGGAPCTSVRPVGGYRIGDLSVLHSPGSAALLEGSVYKEIYVACDAAVPSNMMVLRLKSGGWHAIGLLPGMTIAQPVLQKDALRTAMMTAVFPSPKLDCTSEEMGKTFKVVDTRVLSATRPDAPDGVWVERWTQTVCGQDRSIELHFVRTPSDGGTNFSAKALWPGGERIGGKP